MEAFSLMKHSADEETIKRKMKLTYPYHHNIVLDPQHPSNIPSDFPHFKGIKGLVYIFIIIRRGLVCCRLVFSLIAAVMFSKIYCAQFPPQIKLDFLLIFGEEILSRLLERWPTTLEKKIIQQYCKLHSVSHLEELLQLAELAEVGTEVDSDGKCVHEIQKYSS